MLQRALAFGLTLMTSGVWLSPEVATAQSQQGGSRWLRTDTQHFEIHYLPTLTRQLDRVVRSAERAHDKISGRLEFVLSTKVPLVIYAQSGPITREQSIAYGMSDQVAPRRPHRSRISLPLPNGDLEFDPMIVHELTHLFVSEIIHPGRGGETGAPWWIREGIAGYMVGIWSDDDERLMRALVAAGNIPELSLLTGNGGFVNARLNDAIGHAAFDYIESRWGATSIRRFLNTLIVPRVDKTYDSVFDLTPAEFDAAFRQYIERRFGSVVR